MPIYAIGLGQDVDQVLLADIATKPEWYFFAPDTSDLAEIYSQMVPKSRSWVKTT